MSEMYRSPRGSDPRRRSHMRVEPLNHYLPLPLLILIDLIIFAAALLTFAYFHHVRPKAQPKHPVIVTEPAATPAGIRIDTETTTAAEGDETDPEATDPSEMTTATETTPAQGAAPEGMFAQRFADKFTTDGSVEKGPNLYRSGNLNLTLEAHSVPSKDLVYYTIEVYVRDLKYFKTAFANNSFGESAHTVDMAVENHAIAALSGDYYANHGSGLVVRNGEVYREDLSDMDLLIMYNDGSMETYERSNVDLDSAKARGIYQSWAFGPRLLDDNGQPMTSFNSSITRANPRSAIGYYEPGHYVFLLVDGRQPGYSEGITMADMSQLFYDMGCKVAYNMDGGQSAIMVYDGQVANKPINGGRPISDILYVTDEE